MLNFGSNQKWSPGIVVAPATTEELLQVLREHRGRHIRAVGRLHSWSQVVIADDVLIDLRKMNQVVVQGDRNRLWADVGAGCQIKQLLAELQKQDLTTPTLGLITEQALAGAASTGTHGSGRHSLSHYSLAVTIAIYDPETDEPVMRVIESGDALRAARCALGMLGIVTAIRIPVRPQYHVEEHFRRYDRLEDVLAAERDFPLQQFYLAPWRWDFFA